MYYDTILDVIGNTPLVKVNKLNPNPKVTLLAKLEYFNPGGSIKDRTAYALIQDAEKKGNLKKGESTIIENTGAGNTGIGLAMAACVLGYPCILVLPDKVSEEKKNILRALGAQLVLAPTNVSPDDPRSYYNVVERLVKETPGAWHAGQFMNPANPAIHETTTGPEIWEQTEGSVTHVVIGMGTGGTISGIGRFLKKKNPQINIIGVDHTGSVLQEYFRTGKKTISTKTYLSEGIGEDFIPKTTDFSVIDDIIQVEDKDCFSTARQYARQEGVMVGGSGGAALFVACRIAQQLQKGIIVAICPDTGRNYLSKFYNDTWMREFGFI